MAFESVFNSSRKVEERLTDIIQNIKWCGWKTIAVDDPEEIDHMWNVSLLCEGKVLGKDSNERPGAYYIAFYCLLYCILLSTGFTVRKLYYVSILFYYASVFDFPKYKKLYIALCYGRKNTSFLEVFEFLSRSRHVWSEIGVVSAFPCFDTKLQTTSKWQNQLLQMNWNRSKCKNIH